MNGKSKVPDVIVLGGGIAGLCAALEAASLSARVLLVEKQSQVSGSTIMSGSYFAFAGTQAQKEKNIDDSAELLFKDLIAVSRGKGNRSLARAYCDGQLDMYQWLVGKGILFNDIAQSAGQSVPRGHQTHNESLVRTLEELCRADSHIDLVTNTCAVDLIVDAGDRVVGCVLRDAAGKRCSVHAKAVILATGGFARSAEYIEIFAPKCGRALAYGGAGSTGDGLKMAWKLGASVRDMGYVRATFGTHPKTGVDQHEAMVAYYLGAVIVNDQGQRFVDESISYKEIGEKVLDQENTTVFQVFDNKVFAKSRPIPTYNFVEALERGLLIKADSIDDLAEKAGINAVGLKGTLADYNTDIGESGVDSKFRRSSLCSGAGSLLTISQAPFFAYASLPFLPTTYGGLGIDANAQVLDVDGHPIAGLYAVGEVSGGFHGDGYMTGTSLGSSAYFGRVAARHALS